MYRDTKDNDPDYMLRYVIEQNDQPIRRSKRNKNKTIKPIEDTQKKVVTKKRLGKSQSS